jgi:hypothetical protein
MEPQWSFCGRPVTRRQIELIREVAGNYPALSRTELAQTVCELLGWKRPAGGLKWRECLDLLSRLEADAVVELPAKQVRRPVGSKTHIPVTAGGDPGAELTSEVGEISPISLERVREERDRLLFRELIGRHHYLGYAVPFGARLQYLVYASRPQRQVVGCLQLSSPAWRMSRRDAWIGWSDEQRQRNLQRIVNNSRFLILPWVRVKNLASVILSRAMRCVEADWEEQYAVRPVLVETLVDGQRYAGGCYRAANFVNLGETTGRGRMDREHRKEGLAPKSLWVYPLHPDAVQRLRES